MNHYGKHPPPYDAVPDHRHLNHLWRHLKSTHLPAAVEAIHEHAKDKAIERNRIAFRLRVRYFSGGIEAHGPEITNLERQHYALVPVGLEQVPQHLHDRFDTEERRLRWAAGFSPFSLTNRHAISTTTRGLDP